MHIVIIKILNICYIRNSCIPGDEIGEATRSRVLETVKIYELGVRVFVRKETVVDGVDGDGVVVGGIRFTVVFGGDDECDRKALFG